MWLQIFIKAVKSCLNISFKLSLLETPLEDKGQTECIEIEEIYLLKYIQIPVTTKSGLSSTEGKKQNQGLI